MIQVKNESYNRNRSRYNKKVIVTAAFLISSFEKIDTLFLPSSFAEINESLQEKSNWY